MESVNLKRFLDRATPYERWRAPLEPSFRRVVILSGITIVTTLIVLLLLPKLVPLADSSFFLVLGPVFGGILDAMLDAWPVLLAVNLASIALYAALLFFTQGLKAGRAVWQWAAFGEAVIGAVNGFVLTLELAIVVINLLLWIVIITVAIALALAVLAGIANG
jgi:hypothetical protein